MATYNVLFPYSTYYSLYVVLQQDHNSQLISYPYYAKYVVEKDKKKFRHIDINVRQFLETGRGGNTIQGSVSMDPESDLCCTEIVPGFHRNIKL